MRLDRVGHDVRLVLQRGVAPTHLTLKLGKLAHDLRRQVRLGERGRATGEHRVRAHPRREVAREAANALHAVALRAELLVEHDVEPVELRHALVERTSGIEPEARERGRELVNVRQRGLVGAPEIQGVGEPRPHHLGVAGRDRVAAVLCLDVRYEKERVGQPLAAAGDEALLVRPDGEPDDLVRDLQEGRIECAGEHDGPFHQIGHLFEQSFVLDQLQSARERDVAGVVRDLRLATFRVEHHPRALQRSRIIVEPAHLDRVRRHEAVAVGRSPAGDPADLERHDLGLLRLRSEDAKHRLQRSHPAKAARLARSRPPTHRLRPGKVAQDGGNDLGDDLGRRTARLDRLRDEEVALLGIGPNRRLVDRRQPGRAQEALDRLLRRVRSRSLPLVSPVGGAGRKPAQVERQAARRPIGGGALVGQARVHQRVRDERAQVARGTPLHACGYLLGEEFEQEIGHGVRSGRARA